jgi:hypothetical protein
MVLMSFAVRVLVPYPHPDMPGSASAASVSSARRRRYDVVGTSSSLMSKLRMR